jgi:hypothetical protein
MRDEGLGVTGKAVRRRVGEGISNRMAKGKCTLVMRERD